MAYISPYQPDTSKNELRRIGMQAGRGVLEKTIIYGAQIIKFIVQFIIDAVNSVLGR